jgi:hypothetical protein
MKKANLIFLEMLANTLLSFRREMILDTDPTGKYTSGKDKFCYISSEWCENVAEELKKIALEERMGENDRED